MPETVATISPSRQCSERAFLRCPVFMGKSWKPTAPVRRGINPAARQSANRHGCDRKLRAPRVPHGSSEARRSSRSSRLRPRCTTSPRSREELAPDAPSTPSPSRPGRRSSTVPSNGASARSTAPASQRRSAASDARRPGNEAREAFPIQVRQLLEHPRQHLVDRVDPSPCCKSARCGITLARRRSTSSCVQRRGERD